MVSSLIRKEVLLFDRLEAEKNKAEIFRTATRPTLTGSSLHLKPRSFTIPTKRSCRCAFVQTTGRVQNKNERPRSSARVTRNIHSVWSHWSVILPLALQTRCHPSSSARPADDCRSHNAKRFRLHQSHSFLRTFSSVPLACSCRHRIDGFPQRTVRQGEFPRLLFFILVWLRVYPMETSLKVTMRLAGSPIASPSAGNSTLHGEEHTQ